jgi:hypothetical protein
MRLLQRSASIFTMLMLAACSVNRPVVEPSQDYVEVDNPAYTMSPNASPTMFVPRRYVEEGIPRGKELIKQGVEAVTGSKQEPSSVRPSAAPPP